MFPSAVTKSYAAYFSVAAGITLGAHDGSFAIENKINTKFLIE